MAQCSNGSESEESKAYERFCSTTSGVTFMSTVTDEEYDLLPLPEVDEDYLDDEVSPDDSSREVPRCVSFANIHNEPVPLTSTKRRCYLPGQKIYVVLADVHLMERGRLLSHNMYIIHLTHGDYQWTITRRYKQFRQLHDALLLYRAKLTIPIPMRHHKEERRKFGRRRQVSFHFPKLPESLVRQENMEKRKHQLELYLQNVLRCPSFRNHPETLKFLEVSHLSFVNNLGGKWKEGYVSKRPGGRRTGRGLVQGVRCMVGWMALWTKRWLIVKDTFVAYIRPSDGVIADVILMDRDFNVKIDHKETGITNGLRISNLTRHLSLRCSSPHQMQEWQKSITEAAGTTGSEFTTPNRFKSFAPERDSSYVSWFQDAASYMSAAADAMEAAREEIFITDWWLSPEVYMKRPHTEGNHWRLDKILQRKAEEGVKIFVLLYKEMEFAVGLNSYYSKQALTKLHPNIKVLRHPDGFSLWSHHEKCIVIDQRVAFLGGVDICYGRWDTPSHRLTDLGSVTHNHQTGDDVSLKVDIHEGDRSSTESFNHGNISRHLWMQMQQPKSTFSTYLTQALLAPMLSVPDIALSDTHLNRQSKTTTTVKSATSDSELVIKRSSYHSDLGGSAVSCGDVSCADENTNRNSAKTHISPQTANVSIVIENMDEDLDLTTDASGLSDLDAVIQRNYCDHISVMKGRPGVVNGGLCLDTTDEHDRVAVPTTQARISNVTMQNNNEINTNASTKIPYSHCDNEHQKVVIDKQCRVTEICQCTSSCSKQNQVDDGVKCHINGGESRPTSSKAETLNPNVAETFLKLFAQVKSSRTSPKDSGAETKPDLLNAVSMQNGNQSVVPQHPTEREPRSVENHSQNSGKTRLNREAYHEEDTSEIGNNQRTGMSSAGGGYHCISLDLTDGVTGKTYTCPDSLSAGRGAGHSKELKQWSSLEKDIVDSKPNSLDTKPKLHGGNQSENVEPKSCTKLNISNAEQRLQPFRCEQTLETHTVSVAQTLEPNTSETELVAEPQGTSTKPTLEPNASTVRQALQTNQSSTQTALQPNTSNAGEATLLTGGASNVNHLQSEPTSTRPDLLTVDPPDLSFSMLKNTLEPNLVRLRPHSGCRSRERRSSLSTLSCFIRDGEPLLLYSYLEGVGDTSDLDGQQSEDTDAEEAEPAGEPTTATSELPVMVKTPENKKGFWRLKGRGISLDIKAAVSRAQTFEEHPNLETGIPYISPTSITAKPSTPQPSRKPTFFQKARMIQHIKGKFIRSPKPDECSCDVRGLIDNSSLFEEPVEPPSPGVALQEMGLEGDTKLWIGKDYTNFIQKDFVDLDQPFTDIIDRRTTPRMPWHDIGAVVYGKAARDVGRHFIQRWNFTKQQKRKTSSNYPMLLPKSYRRVTLMESITKDAHCCNCQILRSASQWSTGVSHIEDSIQQAYLQLIHKAKHFIYIENQFFISTCDNHTENGIAEALYKRIIKAHSQGEVFRVYVVMPLLPAFEGELGTSSGAAIQIVMLWNYLSIARGGKSLLERLAAKILDPFEYITFYGLRTHGELVGNLTTELIYVHSKLMIVDDTKVIIGSANINDRSLIGKRDSELAIVVEDTKMVSSHMNGQSCMVGRYASSLRQSLFREHLGLASGKTSIDLSDPVISSFYKGVWMKQATINTSMYDKVFNCIPSDKIHDFRELRQQQKIEPLCQTCPTEARHLLTKVKGHLVLLPLRFLCREHLQPAIGFGTKEALVPSVIWT